MKIMGILHKLIAIIISISFVTAIICQDINAADYQTVDVITEIRYQWYDITASRMWDNGKALYKYNKKGLITHKASGLLPKFSAYPTYEYDKDNRIVVAYDQYHYTYNKKGQLIATKYYNEDENISSKMTFSYNKKNQICKTKSGKSYISLFKYNKGNRVSKYIPQYSSRSYDIYYDEHGNIKAYTTNGAKLVNGTPVEAGCTFENEYNGDLLVKRTETSTSYAPSIPDSQPHAEIFPPVRLIFAQNR